MTKYQAFISYAHSDEAVAKRVHKALETYAIPQNLKTKGQKLSPIFRDVTELTAHHSLSEKIRDAVQNSRFLIVLCSPASKNSHWVNEEIKLFRQLHGEGSILCALIEGTPQTSFPPALIAGGREPLAANMTGRKESFRFGITQMAAAMLGVGLDELVQRDARRRRNRLRVMSAASLAFAAIMGGMAWMAMDARDAAEVSRSEAENMVEYLITDLKQELDAVGRLSILDDVGTRVTNYYDAIPLSDMDDERLTRQARARHVLGEVAIKQGRLDHALTELTASYAATEEFLRRNPNNPEAIFAHAQSEYWVGRVFLKNGEAEKALPSRLAYSDLSKQLYEIAPANREYVFEYGWAENNLGLLYQKLNIFDKSEEHYKMALKIFSKELEKSPDNKNVQFEISSINKNLARTFFKNEKIKEAKLNYTEQISILKLLLDHDPEDSNLKNSLLMAKIRLNEILISEENLCDQTEIILIVDEMESLLLIDSSNYESAHRYPYILYGFLRNCQNSFEREWVLEKLEKLMAIIANKEYLEKNMVERVAWLKNYQAKLANKSK